MAHRVRIMKKTTLNKITKNVAKGVKIGALGALLATSTVGCTMNSDGNSVDENGVYQIDSYKFERYDFLPDNPREFVNRLMVDPSKNMQENACDIVVDVNKFGAEKVAAAKNNLQREYRPDNDLQDAMYEAYTKLENGFSRGSYLLDTRVLASYNYIAKYFAQIINQIENVDNKSKFRTCYDMLAYRAYYDSCHTDELGFPEEFPASQDLPEIRAELRDGFGIPNNNYDAVENEMDNLLAQVATKNNLKQETLKDSINLALMNESIYGVRDYMDYYDLKAIDHVDGIPSEVAPRRTRMVFNQRLNKELDALKALENQENFGLSR